jgi:hypothetical protein
MGMPANIINYPVHCTEDPSGLGQQSYMCLGGKSIGADSKNNPANQKLYCITAYSLQQEYMEHIALEYEIKDKPT